MASTFSTSNRFNLQATGDNPTTWGSVLNNNVFVIMDEALDGITTVDISIPASVTLSTANGTTDEARKRTLVITGAASAAKTIVVPALNKFYLVKCNYTGAYTTTVKTSSDAGVVLQNGDAAVLYVSPSGVFVIYQKSAHLLAGNNLSDIVDKVAARANLGLGNPAVNTFVNNGATTTRTLTQDPGTVNAVIVVFDGVVQKPNTDYTLSGTTLTYTTAPANGTVEVIFVGNASLPAGTPSDGTVTTVKIASSALATQAEAEALTDNAKIMTPLRARQQFTAASLMSAIFQDQKASGTAGGTFTSGAWQTRTLNTSVVNGISGASLASNQFVLPAGSYEIYVEAVSNSSGVSQLRLQNISDASTVALGNVLPGVGSASVTGRVTIATSKTFEIQHRCAVTKTTDGLGVASSWGTEVYCSVIIKKLG